MDTRQACRWWAEHRAVHRGLGAGGAGSAAGGAPRCLWAARPTSSRKMCFVGEEQGCSHTLLLCAGYSE